MTEYRDSTPLHAFQKGLQLKLSDHEAQVARFLETASKQDPLRYREVCERYPVLSASQMARRARHEVPISQFETKGLRSFYHDLFYSSAGNQERDIEESA